MSLNAKYASLNTKYTYPNTKKKLFVKNIKTDMISEIKQNNAKQHSSLLKLTEDSVFQLNQNFQISFGCISPPISREIKFATQNSWRKRAATFEGTFAGNRDLCGPILLLESPFPPVPLGLVIHSRPAGQGLVDIIMSYYCQEAKCHGESRATILSVGRGDWLMCTLPHSSFPQ